MDSSPLYLTGSPEDQWPCIRNIAQTFQKKLDSANIVSIGAANLEMDAQIVEKVGGYWHIFCTDASEENNVAQLMRGLKGDTANLDERFVQISKKFIDPDLIRQYTVDQSRNYDQFQSIESADILKIDSLTQKQNRLALFQALDRGFRPSFIFVRFTESPDANVPTQLMAGHLQNCGYILIGVHENKYVYYFNNDCLYDYARFSEPHPRNPIMDEILSQIRAQIKSTNK